MISLDVYVLDSGPELSEEGSMGAGNTNSLEPVTSQCHSQSQEQEPRPAQHPSVVSSTRELLLNILSVTKQNIIFSIQFDKVSTNLIKIHSNLF